MFLVLTFAVVLHQVCASLSEKVIELPLQLLMIRLVESFGRITIFPLASALFTAGFGGNDPYYYAFLYALVIPITILISVAQLTGLRQSYRASLTGLVYKVNSTETNLDKLTWLEILVFNLFVLKKVSLSNEEIKEKRAQNGPFHNPLKRMKKVTRMVGEGADAQEVTVEVADGEDPDKDFLRDLKQYGSEEVKDTIQHKESHANTSFDLNNIYQTDNLAPQDDPVPVYQPVYY
jgi:preprotein translocase subunit SecG